MNRQEAREEYARALKAGLKEYKEQQRSPRVLDEIVSEKDALSTVFVGTVEIPVEQIVGTKSAGRISAFTGTFLPLLDDNTEFAGKWVELCAAHLSDGIRDPITCVEYLGEFYVQEGNKRVSVMRWFGAARIPAVVTRILPPVSQEPRIKAYYEFLDFYEQSGLYRIQYRAPGNYQRLLSRLGKDPGESWTERERRAFSAGFQYFREAFLALGGKNLDLLPEEALLLWLKVHDFKELSALTAPELKQTLVPLWDDLIALTQPEPVKVETAPVTKAKPNIISRIITAVPDRLQVAFVQPQTPENSLWVKAHDEGRQYIEEVFGDQIAVRSYFHADSPAQTQALLEQAVEEGAQVVFTTTPPMGSDTLKAALKYPKVRFLNCSVNVPYPSIRTYYSRIYEAKFITGAIAGAMAKNDVIGYVGSYPIYGVPASINAFALGAQMTNPNAKIRLRWSCLPGSPVEDFIRDGIRVISNRDVPTRDKKYLDFCNYGTYLVGDDGRLSSLGSPCWVWGKCYENVIRSILTGTWNESKKEARAVNYWWGMDSGVADVELSENLPEGVRSLANMLRDGLRRGTIDPFARQIIAQDGTVKNDGSRTLSADEVLRMDWLCRNVEGSIPAFDEILPYSQRMVRELGVYSADIPPEKEGSL
ncbi:MAG: BMP family ABC transporter substrate-binding protein [Oscillospiraceae bacterium]|nr:BMP family ABC transporter substrate-binding protein [Oscillospiraceae bacterium]